MQLTLCDEFDLFTLSRFLARLERPFRAADCPGLRRPGRSRLASYDTPDFAVSSRPLVAPAAPAPAVESAWESFEEEPERWDGLS